MLQFSANLGFLWTEHALADGIRRAQAAGFAAVECHFPYDQPIEEVQQALTETGLPMLGLNTIKGTTGGLAAQPDQIAAARQSIQEAVTYGAAIGALNIHVMAGLGEGARALACFQDNLKYATDLAGASGMQIVIEPLNAHDVPGYFLKNTDQAIEIIESISQKNLRLMFDCYHVGRTEGAVIERLQACWPWIGHIQFAGVPDRGAPDQGTLDYREVFAAIVAAGWDTPLGAEYRVKGSTEDSLGWMQALAL